MTHDIKINSRYFKDILLGKKTFEIRLNDRNYQVNDILKLHEVFGEEYTGNQVMEKITYILSHKDFPEGIPEGYVVFSIKI